MEILVKLEFTMNRKLRRMAHLGEVSMEALLNDPSWVHNAINADLSSPDYRHYVQIQDVTHLETKYMPLVRKLSDDIEALQIYKVQKTKMSVELWMYAVIKENK